MLIVLCLVKVSWAKWGDAGVHVGYEQGILLLARRSTPWRVLLFYPFCEKQTHERIKPV